MDTQKVNSQMQSLAFGEAMAAAAEDYKKELTAAEAAAAAGPYHEEVDIDELLNDPDLEKLHEERLSRMREEAERRATMQRQGHGTYEEVPEGEFLELVTKTPLVVAHFFHRDFERCRIVDRHLTDLSKKYFGTRFIKISAPDAPFFVEKLKVKTLPCILCFIDGVAVDRIVGFSDFANKDDFSTAKMEERLIKSGAVKPAPKPRADDSDDEDAAAARRTIRQGFASTQIKRTESDEDSDFD